MGAVYYETVFFSGHVQGVGFRFTVSQIAKEFEVTGTVANLADGRVQLEAEGKPDDIAAFVSSIEERMHGFIRKTERSSGTRPQRQFTGFSINR